MAETERISFICDSKLKAEASEVFEKQAIPFRIEAASSRNADDERMM